MKQGGIEEGEWKFYDQDGVLKQVVNYRNGIFNGPFKNYYFFYGC